MLPGDLIDEVERLKKGGFGVSENRKNRRQEMQLNISEMYPVFSSEYISMQLRHSH